VGRLAHYKRARPRAPGAERDPDSVSGFERKAERIAWADQVLREVTTALARARLYLDRPI